MVFMVMILGIGGAAAQGEPAGALDAKPPLSGGAPAGAPTFAAPPQLAQPAATTAPSIEVWYGPIQSYGARQGRRSDPQRWVNILGRVTPAGGVSLTYTLNGGQVIPLTLGPDDRRLAQTGDFNIELDYSDLKTGPNQVLITAVGAGGQDQETVTVNYSAGPDWTPGTYVFNWGGSINNTGQVVDGQWALDGNGVRPTVFDYDRLIALGDMSWRDYTVTVPITIISVDNGGYLAPSNGPGVGFLTRWHGHYDSNGGATPFTGWSRLGALGWYRWYKEGTEFKEGLQLVGNNNYAMGTSNKLLTKDVTYNFKMNFVSSSDPAVAAYYQFKVWPANAPEPATWDLEGRGQKDEPRFGSLLLVAHHVDARFGPVTVQLASTWPRPTVSITTAGEGNGAVQSSPPGPSYGFYQDVVLTAIPGLSSTFSNWQGDVSGTATSVVIEDILESQSVTAVFDTGGHALVIPVVVGAPGD